MSPLVSSSVSCTVERKAWVSEEEVVDAEEKEDDEKEEEEEEGEEESSEFFDTSPTSVFKPPLFNSTTASRAC